MEKNIGDRIKQVRTKKGKTQQEFADSIGINRSNVANYENGIRTPVDAVVSLICREYHINETWLRTGEGEMEAPVNEDEELAAFFAEVYQAPLDDACRRAIAVLQYLNKHHPDAIKALVEAADITSPKSKEG